MKIWYPRKYKEETDKNTSVYIASCQINLYLFKSILKRDIIFTKWNALTKTLTDLDLIHTTMTRNYKAIDIAYQYINNLRCVYDSSMSQCCYCVSDMVKCKGSTYSLNDMVQLIEYGSDNVPPMNWVRHSYLIFKDNVLGGVKT